MRMKCLMILRIWRSKRTDKKQENINKTVNPNVKVTFLPLTRIKNISIALSKLKMSLSKISEAAAIKLDQSVLKLNVVGSLLEACPKKRSLIWSAVIVMKEDKAQLDLPEQFVLEIKGFLGLELA